MKIFSGVQATGSIHIGNYLGAIKQWVELQNNNECIFSIVDLHSLTIPYDQKTFKHKVLEAAIAYLAAGINPEKSILFIQSHVKEHTELTWLLNTITPIGELKRMTQYKEKVKQFKQNINAGLLDYPVLMASDILLYKTDGVPVGEDQVQHVELTRTIARKFNQRFGEVFVEPKVILPKFGARIMALNNPKKKMSKSAGPQSYISLFEEPEEIKRKVMSAVTDLGKEIKFNPSKKPGISNLLIIYSSISNKKIEEVENKFEGKGYAEFKKSLAELLINFTEPFRKKKKELKESEVKEILEMGAKRARTIAEITMQEVRSKMGLI
jgi:tryptophanyl-tRNA synthetase